MSAAPNNPRTDLRRLREARSRELRGASAALDQRQASLQRLATIDAEIDGIESGLKAQNKRRRIANLKLANCIYRDGSPRDTAGHREIVRRYAWGQQARNQPMRRGSRSLVALLRLCELERLWSVRYGGMLPNDDAGADDLWIAAQLIRRRRGEITEKFVAWARVWAPWCSTQEAAGLAAHVVRHPYEFKADTLAEKVGLTYAERQKLGITTIGAVDVDLAERTRLRRQRAREAETNKRRIAGVMSRDVYEEGSAASWRPWEDQGISRSTWYRRRRLARVENGDERVEPSKPSKPSKPLIQNGWIHPPLGGSLATPARPRRSEDDNSQHDTGLRSAGYEVAMAGPAPVSAAFQDRGDASIVLCPTFGHARSPCAPTFHAAQTSELLRGVSLTQCASGLLHSKRPSNEVGRRFLDGSSQFDRKRCNWNSVETLAARFTRAAAMGTHEQRQTIHGSLVGAKLMRGSASRLMSSQSDIGSLNFTGLIQVRRASVCAERGACDD